MIELSRRDIFASCGVVLSGGFAGCTGFIGRSGSGLPGRVPLYARNEQDEDVSLAYWCSTTATVPDELSIDGVAHLESGEESQLTEIPVAASDDDTNRTSTKRSAQSDGETDSSPISVNLPMGAAISITADLRHRDAQRNVLLHVNPESDVFSEAGYLITVLSEPVRDVGTPGQPVSHESVPSEKSITADFIRITPRQEE